MPQTKVPGNTNKGQDSQDPVGLASLNEKLFKDLTAEEGNKVQSADENEDPLFLDRNSPIRKLNGNDKQHTNETTTTTSGVVRRSLRI